MQLGDARTASAGIVVAVITARLMRRYLFKKDETPFVMELPFPSGPDNG